MTTRQRNKAIKIDSESKPSLLGRDGEGLVGAGIYLHIPFCKQACHYCDFHFSTSLKKKDEMVAALVKEIILRKDELSNETVETIYFGGGTPSLLSTYEVEQLIDAIKKHYSVAKNPEITLEANPDDLTRQRIGDYTNTPINRLSIGIQSFFEEDLQLMNRAHNAEEAKRCVEEASKFFSNLSIDLIYGIPNMNNSRWLQNIETALGFGIPHISSYALTVEPKTALANFIKKGIIAPVDDDLAQQHFLTLVDVLEGNGFVHYELSNFGKEGFFSRNNTAYWQGKKYLGIGPSAHSYDGFSRSWNVANNAKYLKAIAEGQLPQEKETLTKTDRYNEYVMTGLRTIWGVSLDKVEREFGETYRAYLFTQAEKYLADELLELANGNETGPVLTCTKKGKFLADGIAADLFLLNKRL